jgi:4-diphosphocytidyl-2-C-methyl-D-erythritol kinase
VRVRVPAKINLFLAVEGLRDDGYHDLTTVLQTVDLHDELDCTLHGPPPGALAADERRPMHLELRHDAGPEVPSGPDNLVLRAATAVLQRLGVPLAEGPGGDDDLRTVIDLRKDIPVAAGMAGGSADAAATLLAVDRLWEAGLRREGLEELAVELGADVPFCLHGGTALATGTGVATARVLARGEFHWVVCVGDGEGLSTPAVFRAHDDLPARMVAVAPDLVLQALRTGDPVLLAEGIHNDLQRAALTLRPALGAGLAAIEEAGALASLVSGSGPTLLGLARDAEHAAVLAAALRPGFPGVRTARSAAGGPRLARDRHPAGEGELYGGGEAPRG